MLSSGLPLSQDVLVSMAEGSIVPFWPGRGEVFEPQLQDWGGHYSSSSGC